MTPSHSSALQRLIALVLAASLAAAQAQSPSSAQVPAQVPAQPQAPASPAPPAQQSVAQSPEGNQPAKNSKPPTTSDRRRAAKLFMQAASLYEAQQFEKAMDLDLKASELDPTNQNYSLAAEVARSHAVTALIQESARDQIKGDSAAARAALERALTLDPQNTNVADHVRGLADAAIRTPTDLEQYSKPPGLAGPLEIFPKPGTQSFHLHNSQRQIIQEVFAAYGITATIDSSVRSDRVRFDLDDVNFAQASRALALMSNSFYVPIDPHRVLVARNTVTNRVQYERNAVDTLYLSGLSTNDMTEIGNIARNVFEVRQMNVDQSAGTITLRGPVETLNAFNTTYDSLQEGRSQVLLDIRLIQLAHNNGRITGIQPMQTLTAFNIYSEVRSILQQNQALVQQIIASGLASPGDTLAILAILIASGAVSSSLFQNGLIVFGGGLTATALVPGNLATVNLNLNSSDSRALDSFSLRLEDGEEGTLKSGSRYPIMTSTYSNLGVAGSGLAGVTLPGTSGSLSSLLAGFTGGASNIPQFQYEDLGLTLKARPRVLRSGDVAISVDLKITALAGAAINNVPILANRAYTGAVTVPANQGVVLTAELDKTESHAISGWPGFSEVPGLNNVTEKDIQTNYATLLIIITPHVLRSPHAAGHTPMYRVEHVQGAR
jgi:type II secretory pathway component GspD/PulD (secretin)